MSKSSTPSQQGRLSKAGIEGITPLMYSCQQGIESDVRHILQKKPISIKDRDRTGKTALHYCAENTSTGCIDLLLQQDSSLLDATDEEGYTPLHLAVIAGNKAVVRHLIGRGADVHRVDSELHSAVHWATVCGEVECLEILLDCGADPSTGDIHGAYPLHYAAQMCGQKTGQSAAPVRDARLGLAVLKRLLANKARVDVADRDGRQPLLWAASSGSADAILALVNAEAAVDAADKDGLTALHCAASRGHSDCVETLVALCSADVDQMDCNGCTPLFYAVTLGHADCAQILLNHGANPSHQDNKGRTPAYCGASKGQMETLRLLVQHGGDMWVRNARGDVALHEAIGSGRKDLVTWLLRQRGSAVNLTNNEGRSPLHIAAINNNVEMCKILIDHDAEVNAIMRSSRGQLLTPLDAAVQRGNRGCAKFLQLHGGLPAAKLTDSRALQRALSRALTESQRASVSLVQVDDYPSLTDSQMSTTSGPYLQNTSFLKQHFRNAPLNRLEDSGTQTKFEEALRNNLLKDANIQITSADLRSGDSSRTRRRTRRRATRRSQSDARPPPNDTQLRRKQRLPSSDGNESDTNSSLTDEETTPRNQPSHQLREKFKNSSRATESQTEDLYRQSVMSSLGAESSSVLKDSGISDIQGALISEREDFTEEDSQTLKSRNSQISESSKVVTRATVHASNRETNELRKTQKPPEPEEDLLKKENIPVIENITPDTNHNEYQSNSIKSQGERESLTRLTSQSRSFRKVEPAGSTNEEQSRKSSFAIRRSKSERMAREPMESSENGTKFKSNPTSSMSVTRANQLRTRRYNMERKLFHQLLELKQLQIRSGQASEQVLVKRLVEAFKKDSVTVGLRPYNGPFAFKDLEKYLYQQLYTVQGKNRVLPPLDQSAETSGDVDQLDGDSSSLCTHRTYQCTHALHAYTGIPCAAYIPYQSHHVKGKPETGRTILPKIHTKT